MKPHFNIQLDRKNDWAYGIMFYKTLPTSNNGDNVTVTCIGGYISIWFYILHFGFYYELNH